MTGSFVLLRPGWLAVCLTLITAYAALLRTERRRRDRAAEAEPFVRSAITFIICVAGVAFFAAWLVYVRSAATHLLLLLGGLPAAGWATAESYRRALSRERAALGVLLSGARIAAWMLLLILAGRPAWDWVAVEWRKPRIEVLLDDSLSMSIEDSASQRRLFEASTTSRPDRSPSTLPAGSRSRIQNSSRPAGGRSRARIVNDRTDRLSGQIRKVSELFDLRVSQLQGGVVDRDGATASWRIEPVRPLTSLAAAIERVADLGASKSRRPYAVLVISDGAENAEAEGAVRRVASRLSDAGVALFAVGAGPNASETRSVEIQPLNLPARIGMRDRLSVQINARLRGYQGAEVSVEVSWSDEIAASESIIADQPLLNLTRDFDVSPPAPGFQRLTVRITLGPEYGSESFETHALIEVTQGRTRVLMIEAAPRPEAAFVTRALLGDDRFELTRKFLPRKPGGLESEATIPPEMWAEFDIILIGSVPRWRLTRRSMLGLLDAVDSRGVGVLLAGGRQFFNDGRFAGTPLEELSPAAFVRTDQIAGWQPRFAPTEIGAQHPLLRLAANAAVDADLWRAAPRLSGAADLSDLKPLATLLADDGAERPLLVSLEFGKGRCLAAAWESTWNWALASDEGSKMHRRFWRQLAAWLANRRPRAWVTADEVLYPLAALQAGQKQVRVRAGVTALDDGLTGAENDPGTAVQPKLTLVNPDGAETPIRLERESGVWVADLRPTTPGDYELRFIAEPAGGERLEANSRFTVARFDLEFKTPTANLALLREAAETTAEQGGRFVRIEALGELLSELARVDRGTRVERPMLYDPVDRARWFWLLMMVMLLGLEWVIRKRAGLV